MTRRLLTAAGTVALALLALDTGHPFAGGELKADGTDVLVDSDGDFLPDLLEWTVMGNPGRIDTDRDGVEDFVEAVQRSVPWQAGAPRPADHEMRIVVTSHVDASGVEQVWMHTLLRLMGDESVVQSYRPWAELGVEPGVRIPLDGLGWQNVRVDRREAGPDGLWYRISFHLTSAAVLRHFLPLTIAANARLGGREVRSGAYLFETASGMATLVPAEDGVVAQTLGQEPESAGGRLSNKYCLMEIEDVGGGPGGRIYEVKSAECENANDLDCTTDCSDNEGWVFLLPDGIGTITGG